MKGTVEEVGAIVLTDALNPGGDEGGRANSQLPNHVSITVRLEMWCGLGKLEEYPLEKGSGVETPARVSCCL